jgi:hypothetical protein
MVRRQGVGCLRLHCTGWRACLWLNTQPCCTLIVASFQCAGEGCTGWFMKMGIARTWRGSSCMVSCSAQQRLAPARRVAASPRAAAARRAVARLPPLQHACSSTQRRHRQQQRRKHLQANILRPPRLRVRRQRRQRQSQCLPRSGAGQPKAERSQLPSRQRLAQGGRRSLEAATARLRWRPR